MVLANPLNTAEQPLYEKVAGEISLLVERGTLRPGERVPSIRKICQQHEVSMATAMQAYRLLESRGVIEARPQSGFYVRPQRWQLPSEPEMTKPRAAATQVQVGELVMEVVQALRDPALVRLGATLPAPELFPTLQLNRTMASAGRRFPVMANSYDPAPGNLNLRMQIARRAMESGCSLSPDDIVITCGATEALNLCLRAVAKPGDTIAIESPTFFGILQIIESLGMRACEIPTYPREGICLVELERRLRSCAVKAYVFSLNFSNPMGCCMPDDKKRRLVELLADRNIPLIEDDIYGNITFGTERPKTAKAYDKKGLVLLCDSFTKTLAPGYRIGWTAPGRFKTKIEFLKYVNSSGTASLPQMGIADFLANGSFDHHVRKIRHFYRNQVQLMSEAIGRYFPKGTRATRPAGGQVLWVELPTSIDSLKLYRSALQNKISIAPGPLFSPKRRFRNFIRVSCGNPWNERIEGAISRLGELMEEML